MSLQVEIIRATEFIRVGPQGHFDLAASKVALATLADACRKRATQHAVLDLRALQPGPKPVFSPADLSELVNIFPAVGFMPSRLRLAVLYASDPFKRARLFAFLSTLHGWSVRAFGDFEEALLWLSKGQEDAGGTTRTLKARRIAIRFADQPRDRARRKGAGSRTSAQPSGRTARPRQRRTA